MRPHPTSAVRWVQGVALSLARFDQSDHARSHMVHTIDVRGVRPAVYSGHVRDDDERELALAREHTWQQEQHRPRQVDKHERRPGDERARVPA